ncbi:MAG: hypothetical protein GC153_00225 [Alphaproteobacteria bacterium]|nr:hypothetical protein [Alphaproteobacteria bacterium]
MLAADNWCVKVDDRIYGPYTSRQLRKFAHEGRLAAWSQVAPAGSRSWREAREEPTFAAFFGIDLRSAYPKSRPFGKRIDGDGEPVETQENSTAPVARPRGDSHAAPQPQLANFIVIFDVVNAAASRVETAMLSLGPAFRIAENVWTVRCELTAIGVRNAITPYLLPRESIFVVDATRGRSSWQNYSPETHAKIAAAWAATRQ